ncbi:MAG: hypothetical protein M1510_12130 [Nitrospirae bacterium]|nr:hypothetical protein [Nitrospirota bacterium]MCL5238139.1 hypothetical protein [Nitrospirota bacterium]
MKKFLVVAATVLALMLTMAGQFVHAGAEASPLSGKVTETMNSSGYTYVQLDNKGHKTWVAVPQMKVTKGQQMAFQPGAEMVNFESKTLKRKFDKIYFSAGPIQ